MYRKKKFTTNTNSMTSPLIHVTVSRFTYSELTVIGCERWRGAPAVNQVTAVHNSVL